MATRRAVVGLITLLVAAAAVAAFLIGTAGGGRSARGAGRNDGGRGAASPTSGRSVSGATGGSNSGATASAAAPVVATTDFFNRYVGSDGQVDTGDSGQSAYSEGQAYGMLLAVANHDEPVFAKVWNWSDTNLMQPDGLLAWDWQAGHVVNNEGASDADLDVATALVLAGGLWPGHGFRAAGIRYANAILAQETAKVGGQTWLVAGPWARTAPYYIDLSYFSPAAYRILGQATGNPEWSALESSSEAALSEDTFGGTKLPTDWATLGTSGFATPAPPKGGSGVVYGYDAFRVLVRQANVCGTTKGQKLDAKLLPLALRAGDGAGAYTQDGQPAEAGGPNPLYLVATAGAAKAAGKPALTQTYLDKAAAAARSTPGYYLDAWVALGRWMLTTDRLAGCSS